MPRLDDYSLRYKGIDGLNKTYGQYTKLLLHFNGINGSQVITDEIKNTVTVYGNTRLDTSVYKFTPSSCYLDGDGDYLSVPDSEDWDFGLGDFTIDTWIYPLILSGYNGIIGKRANAGSYGPFSAGTSGSNLLFSLSLNGSNWAINQTGGTVVLNTWQHVAFVRYGNAVYGFLNGVKVIENTIVGRLCSNNSALAIGSFHNGGNECFLGCMDELRVSKGIARWTSNFTPLTKPY